MRVASIIFHPIIYTAILFASPMIMYMRVHNRAPVSDWHEALLACLYFALVSIILYGARRDFRRSKLLRSYMVVQYIAVTQFFAVFTFELTVPDTWMLMTSLVAMPIMCILLMVSSVVYMVHRVRRARKNGLTLTLEDVKGNATILGVLVFTFCVGYILSEWL